jgi:hypothetical protein
MRSNDERQAGRQPLTDLILHGEHPFPPDIEELLLRIEELGRRADRWPLGENWPYSPREFEWEGGGDLDGARRDLAHLLAMLEEGRGDDILVDPLTKRPLSSG